MGNVVVLIPIYKEAIDNAEMFSLRQVFKILSNYEIIFFCPESLNRSNYIEWCVELNAKAVFEEFQDRFFFGIAGYNKLLLSKQFYERFLPYKFALIYQLDALVFEDRLEYWCDQNYDYIGAPWFEGYDTNGNNSTLTDYAGNGGLSLRKIASVLGVLNRSEKTRFNPLKEQKYLDKKRYLKAFIRCIKKNKTLREEIELRDLNEDFILTRFLTDYYPDFKVAKTQVAIDFSFEVRPDYLYEVNGNRLPFGCHAFMKYNLSFWKERFVELGIWDDSLYQ